MIRKAALAARLALLEVGEPLPDVGVELVVDLQDGESTPIRSQWCSARTVMPVSLASAFGKLKGNLVQF